MRMKWSAILRHPGLSTYLVLRKFNLTSRDEDKKERILRSNLYKKYPDVDHRLANYSLGASREYVGSA